MKKLKGYLLAGAVLSTAFRVQAQVADTASIDRTYSISEVVMTGTRNETDIRHLSQIVSVVDYDKLEQAMQPSLLPVLTEQVPGLFVTSRGVMGYGVSNGAAGGILAHVKTYAISFLKSPAAVFADGCPRGWPGSHVVCGKCLAAEAELDQSLPRGVREQVIGLLAGAEGRQCSGQHCSAEQVKESFQFFHIVSNSGETAFGQPFPLLCLYSLVPRFGGYTNIELQK